MKEPGDRAELLEIERLFSELYARETSELHARGLRTPATELNARLVAALKMIHIVLEEINMQSPARRIIWERILKDWRAARERIQRWRERTARA